MSTDPGALIVLTAPLTEAIDAPNFILQMSMASLPSWMEFVLTMKYPSWRTVERNADGSAACMPAGVRVLERSLARAFDPADIVACYPDDLDRFIGPRTRVVAVSTHNPLGVTFAAGIFASIFGTSRDPINSVYARRMFDRIKQNRFRAGFRVIVGGCGGWQIVQTDSFADLGIDCVVEGRSESAETAALFQAAIDGRELPRTVELPHPADREAILLPDKRTTFGAVEMTTGCGRRCQFCGPDLNPQLDIPKPKIMDAVRANVAAGGRRASLATEDMFIWGQVRTGTPFFFPNREALLDLYDEVASTPGVDHVALTHSTIAPFVVDPILIARLSEILLPRTPYHLPRSRDPQHRVLIPLIGLETGSVRIARQIMPGKAVPFSIDEWPSVVLEGLRIANENHWYPMMTLMVGNPNETDDDVKATLDLVYEMEHRGLFAFLVPSIFTPLPDTRMAHAPSVRESRDLTPLQWQLILKCWKFNLQPGQYNRWAPAAWRLGALLMWAYRLRKLNGPNSTWALMMFAGLLPEKLLQRWGKIYIGGLPATKGRKELLASLRPGYIPHLRRDSGDVPEMEPEVAMPSVPLSRVAAAGRRPPEEAVH
jgi:radical SAM superfamily enzyme YgiQ (UPF0313 family)